MEEKEMSISGLYYRYGKTSDAKIRSFLERVSLVVFRNKGIGTRYGYYCLSDDLMAKILENPRDVTFTFGANEIGNKIIENLKEYKTIKYLVKSTSRWILRPDVGEILDQISYDDFRDSKIKAIQLSQDWHCYLPDTEEYHLLMEAKLLVDVDCEVE